MNITLRNKSDKIKYTVFVFLFLVFYNLFFITREIEPILYCFYLVDYTVGFCTKILPGALYSALVSSFDATSVRIYTTTLFYIFLFGVSVCVGKFVCSFEKEDRFIMLLYILFFLVGISSFSFCGAYLEMLDTYWLFFTLILIAFVKNKYLKWLIPILFILSIFVHLSSIILIVPLFVFILLLEISKKTNKNFVLYGILIVSLLFSLGFFVYFILFEEKNLLMTIEEFHKFIDVRNTSFNEDISFYFDYSLYKTFNINDDSVNILDNFGEYTIFDSENIFAKFFNTLYAQIFFTINIYKTIDLIHLTKIITFVAPVLVFLYYYVFVAIRKNKNNKPRMIALIGALVAFPLEWCSLLLFSPDAERWFAHTFTALFLVVLYDIYLHGLEKIPFTYRRNKVYYIVIVVYLMIYAFGSYDYII